MKKPAKELPWLQKYRDLVLTLGGFVVFVAVLGGVSLFFSGKKSTEEPQVEEQTVFRLPAAESPEMTGKQNDSRKQQQQQQSTAFFLRPSPAELMDKLEGLSYQEFKQEAKNLPGLRIMWPAYFFAITSREQQMAQIMLDSSENGFGVVMTTEVNLDKYPEILTLEKGTKIWLAAEITGVDPEGTGQFQLATEYIRFDDYQPPGSKKKPPEEPPTEQ